MSQLEVLPVPTEMVPHFWPSALRVVFSKIPDYDIERTHRRLLLGVDVLWVAHITDRNDRTDRAPDHSLVGAIITTVRLRAPQQRKAFKREDPAQRKSLLIHIAGERRLVSWLPSAVERIGKYAREHDCRMLYISTRKGWFRHMRRWYSREWEAVAIARDRRTHAAYRPAHRSHNMPGSYRLMMSVPAERWKDWMRSFSTTSRFNEEMLHESTPAA